MTFLYCLVGIAVYLGLIALVARTVGMNRLDDDE
jgi:nitrogen fixation-related uncharacterized protein